MSAIFIKQGKDFIKNIERLIMFLVFPIVAIIITNAMNVDGLPKNLFISMFATMHAVFSPIMVISSMVAEEKEKKTLRELMLANVSTVQYLFSVGSFTILITGFTSVPFFLFGEYEILSALKGLAVVLIGALVSTILGMSLGLLAQNSVSVNAYAMPVGMILSFGPMLSIFNTKIMNVTRLFYGQWISDWIQGNQKKNTEGILIVAVNALIVFILFLYSYRKNRKDS